MVRASRLIQSTPPMQHQIGFSLIELLIVITLMALMSQLALPSYQRYVEKARRTDAVELLMRTLQAEEHFYLNNGHYTLDWTALGLSNSPMSQQGHYQLRGRYCEPSLHCIALEAVAIGNQARDGNLGITSRGHRTGNWPGS